MGPFRNAIRRLVKRLLPASTVAAYRRWRYGRSRNNVTILLTSGASAYRWVRSTPDTYRVMTLEVAVRANELGGDLASQYGGDPDERRLTLQALSIAPVGAVFLGEVDLPRWPSGRRWEPLARPRAAAVSDEALASLGGPSPFDTPARLLQRMRTAGIEYGLIPAPGATDEASVVPSPSAPLVLVLSTVPMRDIGGGSRSAQLALELARRGVVVDYVSLFPSYDAVDPGLRFIHPGLTEYRIDEYLALSRLMAKPETGWVLIEVPTESALELALALRGEGWRVCYDMIDRWSDPALGGDWYDEAIERRLIETSDAIVLSATDLADAPHALGRDAVLIPNGVDSRLFAEERGPWPPDFPRGGGPIIGYHGSLYGDWLDWDSVAHVARSRPEGLVVIIGDDRSGHPPMPENVHFLGMKPQHSLPDYVGRFDVGLLPFRITDTTHAVSPLKVYEYLASGVPVAAPPLRSLAGLEGVHTGDRLEEVVSEALDAPRPDRSRALSDHSWEERVDRLLRVIGLEPEVDEQIPVVREIRPAVDYAPSQRMVEEPESE